MKIYKVKFIIVILLFAFILRLIGITRGLWNDEIITLNTIKNNPILNPFYYGFTTNLPLYFYLIKFWSINGIITNLVYLRLLGIIINLANIYYLYKYIYCKNKTFAFFCALFIAISPLQTHYSQELRPYILTQFLITLHFLHSAKNLQKNTFIYDKKLTVISILLLLTHYAAYLYLVANLLIVLVLKRTRIFNKETIKNFVIIGLSKIIIILSVLNNPKFMDSFSNTGITFTPFSIKTFIEMFVRIKEVITFYYYFGFWYYLSSPVVQNIYKKTFFILFILAVILIILEYVKKYKTSFLPQVSLFMITLVMPIGFYLEKFGFYPFGGRHVMPFSIFLYIIIAYLLTKLWNVKTIYMKSVVVIFILVTIFTLTFHQACSITIINTKDIEQKDSYNYCINEYFNTFPQLSLP